MICLPSARVDLHAFLVLFDYTMPNIVLFHRASGFELTMTKILRPVAAPPIPKRDEAPPWAHPLRECAALRSAIAVLGF